MDNKLLELLYCPVTQTKLEYDREHQVLISKAAKLVFLIRDGIPIMLESEAIQLDVWQKDNTTDTVIKPSSQEKKEKPAAKAPVSSDQKVLKAASKKPVKKPTAKKVTAKSTVAKPGAETKVVKKTTVKKAAAKKSAAKKIADKNT